MNLKRILCFVMAIWIIFPYDIRTSAQVSLPQNIITELNTYGILQGDEAGELILEKSVTRAEFAAMVARTFKITEYPISGLITFTDVKTSDWFYDDVIRLTEQGLFSGYPDGSFRPDESISINEAVKTFVSGLGYFTMANESGGYPSGFFMVASKLGIMKNVSISDSDSLTKGNVARMIYNCLDVPMMDIKYIYKGVSRAYSVGNTRLRDFHLYSDLSGTRIKHKGIVEANAETWLAKPYNNLKANQVVIDGYTYNIGQTEAYDYLGLEVEFYAFAEQEEGAFTLESIYVTNKNEVFTMTEREYSGISGGVILGEINGAKEKFRLSENSILIKNLQMVKNSPEESYTLNRGTVTLIDNNGDGLFEITLIEEFDSILVERANESGIWFHSGSFRGRSMLPLDDDNVIYQITDASGELIAPEKIEPLSVVSITANAEGTFYKIRVSSEKTDGVIEEIGDLSMTVNGKSVWIESGIEFEVAVGNEVSFYLNFRGEAAYVNISTLTDNYAYLIGTSQKSPLSTMQVKLVLPGKFVVDEKIDLEDEDATSVKTLNARNNKIEVYSLSNRIIFNGEKISAKEAANRLNNLARPIIRFTVKSSGEITRINEPEIIGADIFDTNLRRSYNGNELVFGGLGNGAFGVTEETKALCIPNESGVTCDKDYLAGIEMLDNGTYSVNGYDILTDNENAHLVVVSTTLRYDSDYGTDENKVSILEEIKKVVDDEGEVLMKLTLWSQSARWVYYAEPDIAKDLIRGDVFLFSLGVTSNRIEEITWIARLSNGQLGSVSVPGELVTRHATLGIPTSVKYNRILDVQFRRVDTIEVNTNPTGVNKMSFNVNVQNGPPVYLYDTQSKEVRPGTTAEIITGGLDKLFFYTSTQKLRMVVIVR